MKCEYCGRTLRPEDTICPGCGALVEQQEATINLEKTGTGQGISPASNMEPNVRYAGFWIRLVALFIDNIIIVIAGCFTAGIAILAGIVYHILCEVYWEGATVGKRVVGIKVVNSKFEQVSLSESFGRNLGRMIIPFTLYIGYIMIMFSRRKRGLHDRIAGTYVVYKDSLNTPSK